MDSKRQKRFQVTISLICVVSLLVIFALGFGMMKHLGNYAIEEILEEGEISVNALGSYLKHALMDAVQGVQILAEDPVIIAALASQATEDVEHANIVLDRFSHGMDTSVTYLLNANGKTIGSSNRNSPSSFVGKNYAFRPYFKQAMQGKLGHYYALGVTSRKRGYYAAFPVKQRGGDILGVVVVKSELDHLAKNFRQFKNCFLVDPHGIIFLSSRPKLVLKSLWPIDSFSLDKLMDSEQFGLGPFEPLMLAEPKAKDKVSFEGKGYLVSRHLVNPEGWSVVLLSKGDRIIEYQVFSVLVILFVSVLVVGFFMSIYFFQKSASRLQESKDYSDLILNLAPSGLFTVNKEKLVTSWNKKAEEIAGYTAEEVIGKECLLFADEPCVNRCGLYSEEVNKPIEAKECFIKRKDGQRRVILKNADLIKDKKGNVIGGIESFEDVTDRKGMEDALRVANEFSQNLLSTIPFGMDIVSEDGNILFVNEQLRSMLGVEGVGKRCWELYRDDKKQCLDCPLIKGIQLGETATIETEGCFGGKILQITHTGMIYENKPAVLEVFQDITERKNIEARALRLASIVDNSDDAIIGKTLDGIIVSWNRGAEKIYGYTEEEVKGKSINIIVPPEHPEEVPAILEKIKAGEMVDHYETVRVKKDGSQISVALTVSPIKDEKMVIIGASSIVRDIKERKKAEEEIYKLSYAIEQSASSIAITDIEGNLEYVNPKFCQATGYSFEEVKGQNPRVLKSGDQPDSVYKELWETIAAGKEWSGEFHNKRKDGSFFWELASISAIRNKEGIITHYLKVAEDITERKQADIVLAKAKEDLENHAWDLQKTNEALKELYKEVELKNRELLKLDQLKSDFVSTVSHELRTPLAITTEGLNLILDGIVGEVDEKQKEILTTSKENIDRLGRIINDLLDISKIEAGKIELNQGFVELTGLIKELVEAYQTVVKIKNITLTVDLPADKIYAYADSDKFIQIMNNLLNNAYKFTPDNGKIEVKIFAEGEEVHVSVADNGLGINEEDMKKLFEKFQQFDRKHGPGIKGTGLGLAITKALLELHGGEIWAKSKPNEGTTFHVKLPNYQKTKWQFEEKFEDILQDESEAKTNCSLIIVNLQNFNEINEKYGQKILIDIMNSIVLETKIVVSRPNDEIFLYNPQNIFVVLPGTSKLGASHVANMIKNAIKERRFIYGKDNVHVEVKCGVAASKIEGTSKADMIVEAQANLTRKKKVLIVDDHPQIARMLQVRLEANGYLIKCVTDGEQALETIMDEIPDLIVLDIMMPKMNGYEVFGRLKENSKTAEIPIIILTAHDVDIGKIDSISPTSTPVIEKTGGFENVLSVVKDLL